MSSAVDKLVKNNENGEAKKKDDVKKNEANDKEPDPEKILEAKKKQPLMNNLMLLKKAVLQYQKGHASNLLERAQKTEQFNEQFARSETQNKEVLCNAILQNQQEKIQMAQTEADRAYEERKAEYIQRIFREEQERLQKEIEAIEKRMQERQQGQNPDDPILRLQQENKGINDDYEKFKKDMKQMNEKINKDYKELKKKYQLDENGHKKEDKDKKKQDKKTLDIRGLQDGVNRQIGTGTLKSFNNLKEERPSLRIG